MVLSTLWYGELAFSAKLIKLDSAVESVVLLPRNVIRLELAKGNSLVFDLSDESLKAIDGVVYGPYGDHCICRKRDGKLGVECRGRSTFLGQGLDAVVAGPSSLFAVRRGKFHYELVVLGSNGDEVKVKGRRVELVGGPLAHLAIVHARSGGTLVLDTVSSPLVVERVHSRIRMAKISGMCAVVVLEDSTLLLGPKDKMLLPYSGDGLQPVGYSEGGFLVSDGEYLYLAKPPDTISVLGFSSDSSKMLAGIDAFGRPLIAVDCSDQELVERMDKLGLRHICISPEIGLKTNLWQLLRSNNYVLAWPHLIMWRENELLVVNFNEFASVAKHAGKLFALRNLEGCKALGNVVKCGPLKISVVLPDEVRGQRVEQLYSLTLVSGSSHILLCDDEGRCGSALSMTKMACRSEEGFTELKTVSKVVAAREGDVEVHLRAATRKASLSNEGLRLELELDFEFKGWPDLAKTLELIECVGCECSARSGTLSLLLRPHGGWPSNCTAVFDALGVRILLRLDDIILKALCSELGEVDALGLLLPEHVVILNARRRGKVLVEVEGNSLEVLVPREGLVSVRLRNMNLPRKRPYGLVELCYTDFRGRRCVKIPYHDEHYCSVSAYLADGLLCFSSHCMLITSSSPMRLSCAREGCWTCFDPSLQRYALLISVGEGSALRAIVDLPRLSMALAYKVCDALLKLAKLA